MARQHWLSRPPPAPAPERGSSTYSRANAVVSSNCAELFAARSDIWQKLTTEHIVGPHLEGVIGKSSYDIAGFSASAALTFLDIAWTRENPAEFVVNPARFALGTTLTYLGTTDEVAQPFAEDLAENT